MWLDAMAAAPVFGLVAFCAVLIGKQLAPTQGAANRAGQVALVHGVALTAAGPDAVLG